MNLSNPEPPLVGTARLRLEDWFETMHGAGGYYGPAVGWRGSALSWCGPGHDWRWEGLLDGWVRLHPRAGSPLYADRMRQAFRELAAAQMDNGMFRNSYFENNPLEGGMPHEPAVIAAVLRAVRCLSETGFPESGEWAERLGRFVEKRLIQELWNKTLRTFTNWLQSDFEVYSPNAVASIVETLCDYGEWTGTTERWAPYLEGAAESLLKSQIRSGRLAGALPVSSRETGAASPYLAARCLPALDRMYRRTQDPRFAAAKEALADFVQRILLPSGGIPFMVYADRPARVEPLWVGATAGVLTAMERANHPAPACAAAQKDWILARQTESGAFDTAIGFGSCASGRPDWRDVLPVAGWADKVYAYLAFFAPDALPPPVLNPVRRAVHVRGCAAEFTEEAGVLALRSGKKDWFVWRKKTVWPDVCRL